MFGRQSSSEIRKILGREEKFLLLGLMLLLGATTWVFRGALLNPFHFDDALFLDNPAVTNPGNPWYLLKPTQTRQLTYLTFYWNYRIAAAAPFGYHLVNLLLHLGNVVLLYSFCRFLIERRPVAGASFAQRWLPLAAAGAFALHPIQSEAVNYVYQRSTLLAAFFSMLAMICFLQGRSAEMRRKLLFIASGACFFLAIASKETALVLPMVWLAFDWADARDLGEFRARLKSSTWYVPFLIVAAAVAGGILYLLRIRGEHTAGITTLNNSFHYFLSQVQVLPTYLRMLIWPSRLTIDHDFRPASFSSSYAFACYLLLAAILLGALLIRKGNPRLAFLIVTFLIFLAPNSSFVPSADLMFEHRLYLPMIAGSILLAWGGLRAGLKIANFSEPLRTAPLILFMVLLGSWAGLSKARTYTWGDNVRLWQDAVAKSPLKARPHYNLASAYLVLDRQMARSEFLEAVRLDPGHAAALYNLGWLEQTGGDSDAARKYYRASIQADPANWQAHHSLGNLDAIRGSMEDARREFRITVSLKPDYWPALQNLAALEIESGDSAGALDLLRLLRALKPDLLDARFLAAQALYKSGRFAESEIELRFVESHDAKGIFHGRINALQDELEAARMAPH